MARRIFEKKSVMNGTVQQLWDFHAQPNAFAKLTPPPIFIHMRENKLKSLTEGTVDFTMWLGFIPIHWVAQHEPGPIPTSFMDRQLVGPMAYWEHQHIFRAVEGGVELTDHRTVALHMIRMSRVGGRLPQRSCRPGHLRASGARHR